MKIPDLYGLPTLLTLLLLISFPACADPDLDPDAADLLQQYLRIDTTNPPGNEARAIEFLADILESAGIDYEIATSAPGRANIWARLDGGDEPGLLLLHHVDVVSADAAMWDKPPLSGDIQDGYIYGVDGQTKKNGSLRCISAADGSEQWNMPFGFGSLIAVDGKLIALDENGTLYFAEATPEKYNEISKMETGLTQLSWTPPILANGIIYCRNDKGTLVAIDVRN